MEFLRWEGGFWLLSRIQQSASERELNILRPENETDGEISDGEGEARWSGGVGGGREEQENPGFIVGPVEWDFSFLDGTLEAGDCPVGDGCCTGRSQIRKLRVNRCVAVGGMSGVWPARQTAFGRAAFSRGTAMAAAPSMWIQCYGWCLLPELLGREYWTMWCQGTWITERGRDGWVAGRVGVVVTCGRRRFRDHGTIIKQFAVRGVENQLVVHGGDKQI